MTDDQCAQDEPSAPDLLWRPMLTAPQDGTRILVDWLGQTQIATWNTDQENWQEWPDGDFDCGQELRGWMPLPQTSAPDDQPRQPSAPYDDGRYDRLCRYIRGLAVQDIGVEIKHALLNGLDDSQLKVRK